MSLKQLFQASYRRDGQTDRQDFSFIYRLLLLLWVLGICWAAEIPWLALCPPPWAWQEFSVVSSAPQPSLERMAAGPLTGLLDNIKGGNAIPKSGVWQHYHHPHCQLHCLVLKQCLASHYLVTCQADNHQGAVLPALLGSECVSGPPHPHTRLSGDHTRELEKWQPV